MPKRLHQGSWYRQRCGILLALLVCMDVAWGGPTDHAEFYVATYGLADPQVEPTVARAYRVFERVRAAASIAGRRTPRLKILASATEPWAQALPDGHILLSRGAVGICYRDADEALGDARIAFVLGHELAHLAKDDFWHNEVYRALSGNEAARSAADLLAATSDADPSKKAEIRLKETQADDWGFVYAAVAGFAVDRLLGDPAPDGDEDFFRYWVEQTGTLVLADAAHPPPEDRAAVLRARLDGMIGELEMWRFGVRLMHFDRLEDAVHFFEAFQEAFPSREVFGNLGYVYLRRALDRMPPAVAYRFWLPAVYDLATRAEGLASAVPRGDASGPGAEALALLGVAAENLERAVALDPDYSPAWINLATVQYLRDETHLARHAVERALRLRTGDSELLALQALIIAATDPLLDLWPQAVERLDGLARRGDEHAAPARYNLARLLEGRGRDSAAREQWSWLLEHLERLPIHYARGVCAGRQTHPACIESSPRSFGTGPAFPWSLPVPVGADVYRSESVADELERWQSRPVSFGTPRMTGAIHWQAGRAAVLVLDGYVDTIALYGPELGSAQELRGRANEPVAVRPASGGEVWSYAGWAAVIREGRVVEAWVERAPVL